MGTSVVGRTGAHRVYKYPDPPRSGAAVSYARNFASGPKNDLAVGTGLQIPWNAVDAGTPPTTADVPITPLSTGVVLITGVVGLFNGTGAEVSAFLQVQIDGVDLPVPAFDGFDPIPAGASVTIPFMAETDIPVGATHQVEISVAGNGLALVGSSSLINVQEVSVATG